MSGITHSPEVSSLVPYWMNVFEAAHSSAAHVTLWWLADIICHDRVLLISGIYSCCLSMCSSTHCSKPFATYTVVTYVSRVEVFATRIKLFNLKKLSLVAWLFPSECLDHLICKGSKGKDLEFQNEQDYVTGIQNLCSNTLCCCAKCWNIMNEMLCTNTETSAQNIDVLRMRRFSYIRQKH